jgi:hypothetical protein
MSGQFLDFSAAQSILKEFYKDQPVGDTTYTKNPFWAMLSKETAGAVVAGAGGRYYPQPIKYGNPQGRSAQFGYSQQNQTAAKTKAFQVTYATDYATATIDGLTLRSASTDAGAFIDAVELQIDSAHQQLVNSIAMSMYRDGSGLLGKITCTSGVCTPADDNMITQIEVGQTLVCGSSDGLSYIGSPGYVIAVNRTAGAGTFTVSATGQGGAAGTPASWPATASGNYQYCWIQGDNVGKLSGLAGWIPSATPGSTDSWFGVNRSADTRLSGFRFDATSSGPLGLLGPEEALIQGITLGAREGVEADHIFMCYNSYAKVLAALHSKVELITVETDAGFSFPGAKMFGPDGAVNIIPDRNCPSGVAYAVKMASWKLVSVGPMPRFLDDDGLQMLRVSNADAYETRLGMYGNLSCSEPGRNAVISIGF